MAEHLQFPEVMARHAAERGGHDALVVLRDAGSGGSGPDAAVERVSYARLDRYAAALASWLGSQRAASERVLISQADPVLFAASFLACLYSGAVAVPVPPPGGPRSHGERLLGIVRDAAARFLLTDAVHAAEISRLLSLAGRGAVSCLAADVFLAAAGTAGDGPRPAAPTPESVALLQYTSGTTKAPRGAIITHANLAANQRAVRDALGCDAGQVVGGWLPLHHDLGLLGQLLHPLWLGATSVLMRPSQFARRPDSWLRMISEHSVTVSGAPDFAYELCVQRVTDRQLQGVDLSAWRIAVNAAERIRPATLRAFAERFEPFGLRPDALHCGYGLAEATLLVSFGPARPSAARADSGSPRHAEALIVDPATREPLPDGSVGEIWVRGPGVAGGYWRRPAQTTQSFDAHTADGRGGFLRTGDLGLLRDGRLQVTGRLGEEFAVEGRNVDPEDLERSARQVSPLFGAGVAFPVRAHRDHIVVVQEVRVGPAARPDLAALADEVRERVRADFEVRAEGVLLVRPGTVRRTASGKLERAAVRRLFLDGRLEALHELVEPEVRGLIRADR